MNRHDEMIQIIERNSNAVYRLAFAQMKNRADADDVYQEVFYRYIKKQPVFENEEHEKAWFIRVTVNCSKTSMRSFWKTKVCELDASFEDRPVEKEDLSFALRKLPKKYALILHLFYYEDLSIKEIAQTLKLKDGNVGVLLQRSRKKLKEYWKRRIHYEKGI